MIGRLLCWLGFHNGKLIKNERKDGGFRYFACFRCNHRWCDRTDEHDGPVNQVWLDGGPWDSKRRVPRRSRKRG